MTINSSIIVPKMLISLNFLYVDASLNAIIVPQSISFRELFYLKPEGPCLAFGFQYL